jgi:antitoxin Phd
VLIEGQHVATRDGCTGFVDLGLGPCQIIALLSGAFGNALINELTRHLVDRGRKIRLRDAKATLSSVVDDAVAGKPSVITRHGRREAVVVGLKEWERLAQVPSFGRLLMSAPLSIADLPRRNRKPIRSR